jgi:integrase
LFEPVADDLREWWEACGRPARDTLVFPDARGGVIRASNWHRRTWQPGLRSAGISPFRPYDMRHTCATLLIYAGWNSLEVALHLGHGDPGFTLKTYGHVFRDATPDDRVPIDERIARARRSHAQGPEPRASRRQAGKPSRLGTGTRRRRP